MCDNCNQSSPIVFSIQSFLNQTCDNCSGDQCLSGKYVCYEGSNLPCSGIETGDTLETALTKIDEQICSAAGDYSTYQTHCLSSYYGEAIDNESKFVDAITSYVCTIATNLQSFTGVTFPQYQSEVAAQISNIDGPSLSCTSTGVIPSNNLSSILTKYCTKFTNIDSELDLSDVDFADCFTVTTPPSTVKEGFTEVLSQICQVKTIAESAGGAPPTFNNTGSCLDTPGSNDSLVSTINKIKTKVCQAGSWRWAEVNWDCITPPDDESDLTAAIKALTTAVGSLNIAKPTWSDDFSITQVNESDACQGINVALATPINADRFVAATVSDTSPGVLVNKMEAGAGMSVAASVDNSKVVVTSQGKVKADATDDSLAYLVDKLEGSTVNGITITPVYNSLTKKVTLQLTVDPTAWCTAINACVGSDCASYLITPTTSDTISYISCEGGAVSFAIFGPVTVCAKVGTVNAPASTVVNVGVCTTTTTAVP